jgi:hypothetical protein
MWPFSEAFASPLDRHVLDVLVAGSMGQLAGEADALIVLSLR